MNKLVIIIFFLSNLCYSQVSSNNMDSGMLLSTDIALKSNRIYMSGSYLGITKINDKNLNGNEFNQPLIIVKDQHDQRVQLNKLVTSLNGFAEFRQIFTVSNDLIITGIFTNSIVFNSDTIKSQHKWESFIVRLNENDSIVWLKLLGASGGNHQVDIVHKQGNIFVLRNSASEDSVKLLLTSLRLSDGHLNWQNDISTCKVNLLRGLDLRNDTLIIHSSSQNHIYFSNYLLNGSQVNLEKSVDFKGYNISRGTFNGNSVWVDVYKDLKYNLTLSYFLNNNIYQYFLPISSSYFASVSIFDHTDSIIKLVVHYEGDIVLDSQIYYESDSSNTVVIEFNNQDNKLERFINLPERNVIKAIFTDSTILTLSNYINGSKSIKRSSSEQKFNSDIRLSKFKYESKSILKTPKENGTNQKINLVPNPSNGDVIVLYSDSQISNLDIKLFNCIGQELSIQFTVLDEMKIKVIPNSTLEKGVYFLYINSNSSTNQKTVVKVLIQ